jgi:hypothetical protein
MDTIVAASAYLPIHIKSPFAPLESRVFTYFYPPMKVRNWCVRTQLVSMKTMNGALQQALFQPTERATACKFFILSIHYKINEMKTVCDRNAFATANRRVFAPAGRT